MSLLSDSGEAATKCLSNGCGIVIARTVCLSGISIVSLYSPNRIGVEDLRSVDDFCLRSMLLGVEGDEVDEPKPSFHALLRVTMGYGDACARADLRCLWSVAALKGEAGADFAPRTESSDGTNESICSRSFSSAGVMQMLSTGVDGFLSGVEGVSGVELGMGTAILSVVFAA